MLLTGSFSFSHVFYPIEEKSKHLSKICNAFNLVESKTLSPGKKVHCFCGQCRSRSATLLQLYSCHKNLEMRDHVCHKIHLSDNQLSHEVNAPLIYAENLQLAKHFKSHQPA